VRSHLSQNTRILLAPRCFAIFTAVRSDCTRRSGTSHISNHRGTHGTRCNDRAPMQVRYSQGLKSKAACSKMSGLGFSIKASTDGYKLAAKHFAQNPRLPPVKKTSLSFHVAGPSTTMTAKSFLAPGASSRKIFPSTLWGRWVDCGGAYLKPSFATTKRDSRDFECYQPQIRKRAVFAKSGTRAFIVGGIFEWRWEDGRFIHVGRQLPAAHNPETEIGNCLINIEEVKIIRRSQIKLCHVVAIRYK